MIGQGKMAADRVVRVLLGVFLLAAAALKAHQLATEPVAGDSLLATRWFLILWVEVEILLGLWFVVGLARRAAWGAALGCFSIFAAVTLAKALAGDTSCGCFGRVAVNPWYTFLLDLGAVAALLVFRPPLRESRSAARLGGRTARCPA